MPSARSVSGDSVAAIVATASRTRCAAAGNGTPRAAASIRVFDGTQPVNVQSPPGGPSVTISTRASARAAARAAPSPPAPPPITTRS